jgi:uncharacterized membrane protein YhhN
MTDFGGQALLGVGGVFAGFLLDWLAVGLGWQRIRPYTKAAALVLLVLWALGMMGFAPGFPGWLLILALIFGLAGDILLLFPERCFKWGLGAFLLGHLTYLSLFGLLIRSGNLSGLVPRTPTWAWGCLSLALLLGILAFHWAIIRKMRPPGPSKWMQAALYLYASCLTAVMVASYLTAISFWGKGVSLWALPLGGTLFFISDFILADNRFVRPLHSAHLWIMISYHLAQFFLALGFINLLLLIAIPPGV